MPTATFGPGNVTGDFSATPGVTTPNFSGATPLEPILITASFAGRVHIDVPPPEPPPLLPTILAHVTVSVPQPAIAQGRPSVPRFWARLQTSGSVSQGLGHTRSFPDPDPVWNPTTSSWDVAPPDGPPAMVRWTSRSLPNPLTYPNHEYYLGAPSSVDGTASIESGARQWSSAAGSSISVPLLSAYPFKPLVTSHEYYSGKGKVLTIDRAVRLNIQHVQHLWADMGDFLTPPFTVLVVAAILDFPRRSYRHYLLDAGTDPTAGLSTTTRTTWWKKGVTGDTKVSESFGYRTGLRVDLRMQYGYTDQNPTTRLGRSFYENTKKPKMFFLISNGSHSASGNYSPAGKHKNKTTFANHGAQRNLVIGRANGIISPDYATHAAIFEIRAWNDTLTDDQLDAQYKQLSSTWRFHEYV